MGTLPKIALAALAGAALLFGTRARGQMRSAARPVTRGLLVGDSLLAGTNPAQVLREQTRAPWDNVAVVGANSEAVLRQAQRALRRQGYYSHVVVLAGVNDGDRPAVFTKTNLQRIYQLGKGMGAQVIAVTETPFKSYPSWNAAAQARQTAAVDWLVRYEGGRYADHVVDAWRQFDDVRRPGQGYLDTRYAAADGLHMNVEGQRHLGALILQAIRG